MAKTDDRLPQSERARWTKELTQLGYTEVEIAFMVDPEKTDDEAHSDY